MSANKTVKLTIRMTPETMERWKELAAQKHLMPATYARKVLLDHLEREAEAEVQDE